MALVEPSSVGTRLHLDPYLHVEAESIYNPLTDRTLAPDDPLHGVVRDLWSGRREVPALTGELAARLEADGWLVDAQADLDRRFYLKYVSLEASTPCNQSCYFCPVSIAPRDKHFMSMEFYDEVARQLSAYRDTLEGVSMINYNEPTADPRFVDQVAVLRRHQLPAAVLTNGTGLTPKRVDQLTELGGLRFLSINLSTLDREQYRRDRGGDHLAIVRRNLDYLKTRQLAEEMEIAVLGVGDETHQRAHDEIAAEFAGTTFAVKFYEVMDRAGRVPLGNRPRKPIERLAGCDQTGSRPLQWMHISPEGKCLLCCQDYHEDYVVGDLHEEGLQEILVGDRLAEYRRWAYGLDAAPDDFICRHCVYARSCSRGAAVAAADGRTESPGKLR